MPVRGSVTSTHAIHAGALVNARRLREYTNKREFRSRSPVLITKYIFNERRCCKTGGDAGIFGILRTTNSWLLEDRMLVTQRGDTELRAVDLRDD